MTPTPVSDVYGTVVVTESDNDAGAAGKFIYISYLQHCIVQFILN